MKLRNINPIGHADVPLLYRQGEPFDQDGVGCLQPGEVFDVTEEQARLLLVQDGNYEPADDEAQQLLADMRAAVAAAEEQRRRELAEISEAAAAREAEAAEAQRQHELADAAAKAAYEQAYAAALADIQRQASGDGSAAGTSDEGTA